MKKAVIITSLFLVSISLQAQKTKVISDSLSDKATLYSKSLLWASKTWRNANQVIQLKDPETGTIVIHGGLQSAPRTMGVSADGLTRTEITILTKDGKAAITFENTYFTYRTGMLFDFATPKTGINKGAYTKWRKEVMEEMDALIASYTAALNKPAASF